MYRIIVEKKHPDARRNIALEKLYNRYFYSKIKTKRVLLGLCKNVLAISLARQADTV